VVFCEKQSKVQPAQSLAAEQPAEYLRLLSCAERLPSCADK